ncbi:MAG: Ketopantoate reductase PanG, partial [Myxococcaceae bacterium]|nr:Ketopantoate reductase PanG [Myxococcaceae bacterium]
FTVEGDPAAVAVAREIAALAGGRLIVASAVDRARYHAGAALVASGAVALAQGAAWLLGGAIEPAPSDDDLRAATASLLVSVARNVVLVGPDAALASPLLRDDTATVARHLEVMAGDPTVRALYQAVLRRVLEALERDGRVSAATIADARRLAEAGPRTH